MVTQISSSGLLSLLTGEGWHYVGEAGESPPSSTDGRTSRANPRPPFAFAPPERWTYISPCSQAPPDIPSSPCPRATRPHTTPT